MFMLAMPVFAETQRSKERTDDRADTDGLSHVNELGFASHWWGRTCFHPAHTDRHLRPRRKQSWEHGSRQSVVQAERRRILPPIRWLRRGRNHRVDGSGISPMGSCRIQVPGQEDFGGEQSHYVPHWF